MSIASLQQLLRVCLRHAYAARHLFLGDGHAPLLLHQAELPIRREHDCEPPLSQLLFLGRGVRNDVFPVENRERYGHDLSSDRQGLSVTLRDQHLAVFRHFCFREFQVFQSRSTSQECGIGYVAGETDTHEVNVQHPHGTSLFDAQLVEMNHLRVEDSFFYRHCNGFRVFVMRKPILEGLSHVVWGAQGRDVQRYLDPPMIRR
mmetsp:Transcript_34099/g.63228  ORF Transcript_34099/g.63228 Transcript_34099/m.63228 type:complete len:203 (-) Transcript_34099:286-894(-)